MGQVECAVILEQINLVDLGESVSRGLRMIRRVISEKPCVFPRYESQPSNCALLLAQGHDATHLHDEGLHRMPNGEIFQKAITEIGA